MRNVQAGPTGAENPDEADLEPEHGLVRVEVEPLFRGGGPDVAGVGDEDPQDAEAHVGCRGEFLLCFRHAGLDGQPLDHDARHDPQQGCVVAVGGQGRREGVRRDGRGGRRRRGRVATRWRGDPRMRTGCRRRG